MRLIARLISTCFGIGYSPFAPGTMGALITAIVYWFFPLSNLLVFCILTIIIFFAGVYAATITEKEQQQKSNDNSLHDPGIIVIDEVVGMLIALVAVPYSFKLLVIAFVLFRFFDIAKPFPVRNMEKFPNGWGIVLDDVIAGIYSNIIVQIVLLIFGKEMFV